MINPQDALLAIQDLLDGVEWTADTTDQIARIIADTNARANASLLAIRICLQGGWSPDTLDSIARIMTDAGYRIRDLND